MIKEVKLSYPTIRTIVVNNLPGGFRKQSENGREIYSGYFLPNNFYKDGSSAPDRAYVKVTILGEGRPFDVDVRVYLESREQGEREYSDNGQDDDLAAKVGDRLQKALADRREDRNVIDVFRAF
jgi:hypothetical protein